MALFIINYLFLFSDGIFLFSNGIIFISWWHIVYNQSSHDFFFFFGNLKSLQVLVYIRDATHLNADLELEQQMEQ